MRPETIFAPVSVLAIWTEAVVFWTGFVRIRSVRQVHQVSVADSVAPDPVLTVPDIK